MGAGEEPEQRVAPLAWGRGWEGWGTVDLATGGSFGGEGARQERTDGQQERPSSPAACLDVSGASACASPR